MSSEVDAQGRPIRRGKYPELTLSAVLVGYVLGAIIALSIGYAALILGFSIEGSELAAILGWGILRGIMKRTSIVENNINQTIASAVNGASAGMMFSVPALFILARENPEKYGGLTEFSPVLMVLACITGGILGLAFIIPLRRQMIDFNRLAYPGGIAVAAILKSPGAGMKKARLLIIGAALSGGLHLVMLLVMSGHPDAHVGQYLSLPSFLNITFFLSLMTVGVGFLSGKGGLVFGYGGFICYFLLAPLLGQFGAKNVQEDILDPQVRQSLLTESEVKSFQKIADDTSIHDASAGDALRAALVATDDDQNPTGDRIFDNVKQATAILAAAERIDDIADQIASTTMVNANVKDAGYQTFKEAKTAAKSLRDTSRAAEVVAAAEFLHTPGRDDLRQSLTTQTTAKGVWQVVKNSGLSDASQDMLLNATRAEETYYSVPDGLRLGLFRPTGIGVLIGAAIGGIIAAFPLVRSAIKSMQQAAAEKKNNPNAVSDEMPIKMLYAGVIGGAACLALITIFTVENMEIWRGIAMAVLGTLWIWIAGVIVSECLGRTNWSPLSGMTLIAVTILLLIAGGLDSNSAIISSVICGAAICVAIAQAGDMMLDLKSGYLVGALPKWQQVGQLLGTWLGPILIILLIFTLDDAYGLGSKNLPAPQGAALASMINGVVGGDVPAWRYTAGAGLGLILAFSGLGGIGVQIGLGFYMPFDIVLTYTIGCLARMHFQKQRGMKFIEDVGIPIAAGLIVGEALVGVGNAFVQILWAGG